MGERKRGEKTLLSCPCGRKRVSGREVKHQAGGQALPQMTGSFLPIASSHHPIQKKAQPPGEISYCCIAVRTYGRPAGLAKSKTNRNRSGAATNQQTPQPI